MVRITAAFLSLMLAGTLLLSGCSTQTPQVPPIGTMDVNLPGKVVWHDLVTDNVKAAQTFYEELLGWDFEQISEDYVLAKNNGRLVAGIAGHGSNEHGSYWMPLISVTDINATVSLVEEKQGEVLLDSFQLPGRGEVAVFRDPQGGGFAAVQSSHGDPEDRKPQVGEWLWNEVWTDDMKGSAIFYEKLGGYRKSSATLFGTNYSYLERDGVPRVGLVRKMDSKIGNTWVSYLRVENVADTVRKAEKLGGGVLMPPTSEVRDGKVAIISDPTGGAFVIQEMRK